MATLGGHASVRLDDAGAAPVCLSAGDIALISGIGRYTIADDPSTPPQIVLDKSGKHVLDEGEEPPGARRRPAPRTYGDGLPGATTLLRGAHELCGEVGDRLLAMLPHTAGGTPSGTGRWPTPRSATSCAWCTRIPPAGGRWLRWPPRPACPAPPSPHASPVWSANPR
ncbi:hypothetical protein Pve01_49880 [Planomonospora venezuelensis]|uniref:cupin domain-containing protein n=1 Tax=Planomonospora venezuelensis TaxID=1999 RepID=UPI001ACB9125|nr:hypothetical protein Pve01_49880 [Planomonospora venezuelensis]